MSKVVVPIAGPKQYRIGEIARLAEVSRRTVDYYTRLGLLKPVRSESNYRYYETDALIKLKLIQSLKESRLTLEEIKERLKVIQSETGAAAQVQALQAGHGNVELIKEQFKELEELLSSLPATAALDPDNAALLARQALLQSLALTQALILYVTKVTPELTGLF